MSLSQSEEAELATLLELDRRLGDFEEYAVANLKIRPKSGAAAPFHLNSCQKFVHERLERQRQETGQIRALVLKARQWGCSTYVEGRFYWRVTHRRGVRAMVMAHRKDATENLFKMVSRYHEHCPALVRPHTGASNAKELRFDLLDSGYTVATAGSGEAGRSDTVQYFHGSEVAFWPNAADTAAGALQTVPDEPDTEVILESTANGIGGYFHQAYKAAERGEGPYIAIFVPWFAHEPYRSPPPEGWRAPPAIAEYGRLHELDAEQVHWAWRKNAELAQASNGAADEICWMFKQEYPATAEEAFQAGGHESFIPSDVVVKARRAVMSDQTSFPLVFGVDTARGGPDKTRIIDRQGRIAGYRVNATIDSDDEMEIAGTLARLIDRHDPAAVFVDVTGGTGAGAVSRLKELRYGDVVHGVNFGAGARDDAQYANKRAEMWGLLKEWLNDPGGADIPDDDTLHGHICAPGYHYDSLSRIVLEKKEKIRERVGFSPDGGDALALTFAEPVSQIARRRDRQRERARNPGFDDYEPVTMDSPFN